VSVRSFARNLFQHLGWDLRWTAYPSSKEVLLTRFLSVARPTVVFDVGANVGQNGLSLRKCGLTGRIVSFEAIPSVHARLLLRVDTQRYEEEVLAGADVILKSVYAMQLELSVAPLYQGAPTLRRILELCEHLDFQLPGLIPGFHDENSGGLCRWTGSF
jgi:hypothetical protein